MYIYVILYEAFIQKLCLTLESSSDKDFIGKNNVVYPFFKQVCVCVCVCIYIYIYIYIYEVHLLN